MKANHSINPLEFITSKLFFILIKFVEFTERIVVRGFVSFVFENVNGNIFLEFAYIRRSRNKLVCLHFSKTTAPITFSLKWVGMRVGVYTGVLWIMVSNAIHTHFDVAPVSRNFIYTRAKRVNIFKTDICLVSQQLVMKLCRSGCVEAYLNSVIFLVNMRVTAEPQDIHILYFMSVSETEEEDWNRARTQYS